jgi:hypothetical protein
MEDRASFEEQARNFIEFWQNRRPSPIQSQIQQDLDSAPSFMNNFQILETDAENKTNCSKSSEELMKRS